MKNTSVAEETNTDTRTFALGNVCPKLSEESKNIRPLDITGDGMRKKGFQCFDIFSSHTILVPQNGTTVKVGRNTVQAEQMHLELKAAWQFFEQLFGKKRKYSEYKQ